MLSTHELEDGGLLVLMRSSTAGELTPQHRIRWTVLPAGAQEWTAVQEAVSYPAYSSDGISTSARKLSVVDVQGSTAEGITLLLSSGGPSTQQIRTLELPLQTLPRQTRQVEVTSTLVSLTGTEPGDVARVRVASNPVWNDTEIGRLIPGTIEMLVDGELVATSPSRVASSAPGGESAPIISVPLNSVGTLALTARFKPDDSREFPTTLSSPLYVSVGLEDVDIDVEIGSDTAPGAPDLEAGRPLSITAIVESASPVAENIEFWAQRPAEAEVLLGTSSVIDGRAELKLIDGLVIGSYRVFAVYPGDELRARGVSATVEVDVFGQQPDMEWAPVADFREGDAASAELAMNSGAVGAPVTLAGHESIDGERQLDESGRLSVDLAGLPAGQHDIEARFGGNEIVSSGFAVLSVTVGPALPQQFAEAPAPVIDGLGEVGEVLTATVASWSPPADTMTWQWYRGGFAVGGATTDQYPISNADLGSMITVRVVGSREGYDDAARVSEQVGPIRTEVPSSPPAAPEVARLAGSDRFATSAEVAKEYEPFSDGEGVVYVANGLGYPDALSAAPAAAFRGAPLLLTLRDSLPASVRAQIVRLSPEVIVIAGGAGVVSAAVETELRTLAPTVERHAGSDRYETSRVLTQNAFGEAGALNVFLATGRGFPDALAASAAAGRFAAPVVLVDGAGSSVPQITRDLLTDLGAEQLFIAGGSGVVSEAIRTSLSGVGFSVTRLSGPNRYATSEAINNFSFATSQTVFLAVGTGYADALAGAALAGNVDAPLFVVPGNCVPQGVLDQIADLGATEVRLLGGAGSLSANVANLTRC